MDVEANYEIARVAEFITSRSFTRVALQFPDGLLKDSMRVMKALRQELKPDVKLYVMADTTYGSCCVDEVGAAHINADCVIHFGHTCLSPTSTLPALFIFPKAPITTSNCVRALLEHGLKCGKPVLVLYGLEYAHVISEIKKNSTSSSPIGLGSTSTLEHSYADVSCSVICPSEAHEPSTQRGSIDSQTMNGCIDEDTNQDYNIGGLTWRLPQGQRMEDHLIFWIGSEDTAFANVVLTFNSCEIVRYDATEDCLITDLSQQKRILRRRYYLFQKAKDANMIGILVGTLGAVGYLHVIHQMRELITNAGKKSYTFVMGKPNPAKLANFPECDVFINVSCPQTALLDSKEFLAPIITPYEAMLALERGRQWTGAYVVNFRDLVASMPLASEQSDEAHFSLIQGRYVEAFDTQGTDDEVDKDEILALVNATEKAVRLRNEDTQSLKNSVAKTGAEYFAGRSYHGLDIGNTVPIPGKFLTGRSGKASGYKDETTQ
ncbi:hypothetical protein CASFOL_025212 [Castilleja foliolosa]|uniref:2-(3-amino-3-carboxypropyl)histidine synthase subunit 2 n=1 Tax=Castilleja foliolosa TaxID=1961234 RepID=A0ABD3CQG2_9LAMI